MRILPNQSLGELYFKSIIPSITYSISIWGNCSPSAINSLNVIHARASRIINNLQPSLADDICLTKSNWLPFSYFYKKSVLTLMHKVYFETSNQSMCVLFSKKSTSRSSRFPNQFNIIRFKSNTGRNTFTVQRPCDLEFFKQIG